MPNKPDKLDISGLARSVFRAVMSVVLMVLGLVMIGVGVWNWFDVPGDRITVVRERTAATTQTVDTTAGGGTETQDTTETAVGTEATGTSTNSNSDKTTTTGDTRTTTAAVPAVKTTTTMAPDASRRSEGVTLALVGGGSALLLAGAFFGRISKISFPGGASIELIADQGDALKEVVNANKEQDKVDKVLAAKLAKHNRLITDLVDAMYAVGEVDRSQNAVDKSLAAQLVRLAKRVEELEPKPPPPSPSGGGTVSSPGGGK